MKMKKKDKESPVFYPIVSKSNASGIEKVESVLYI